MRGDDAATGEGEPLETTRPPSIAGPIRLLFEGGAVAGLGDPALLDRFLARDADPEGAEVAFAALVERHGPSVLRACRARLRDEHDAQDAFQATFLILARRARSIRNRESAAGWLVGVARRVASCARRASRTRLAKERAAAEGRPSYVDGPEESGLAPALLEEVGDLPERDRAPLRLCLLDGLTHEEAAARLGCPVGTVKTRVRRAKSRLRLRLARRGFAPSLAGLGPALAAPEASAWPAALASATARAALRSATAPAAIPATVAALVELGLGSLMMTRIKIASLLVASAGMLVVGGAQGLARPGPQDPEKPAATPKAATPKAEAVPKPAEVDPSEVDLARIDAEIIAEKLKTARQEVVRALRLIDQLEGQIESARSARRPQDLLNAFFKLREGEALEDGKQRAVAEFSAQVDQGRERLKQFRSEYGAIKRRLALEEQRIKEMEARVAGSSPGPEPKAEAVHDNRIDRWKLASNEVESLRMEFDRRRDRLRMARETLEVAEDHRRRGPNAMPGEDPKQVRDRADRLNQEENAADRNVSEALAEMNKSSRNLVAKEREARELARGLPDFAKVEIGRPTAEVDRRLADLERKIDLLLKAVEKPKGR